MIAVTLSCFVRVKWKYIFIYLLLPKPNKTKIFFCPLPFYSRCKGIANSGMVSCFSLLDNTVVQHTQAVVDRIHATGVMVVLLPPYSRDFMPHEELFVQNKN